MAEIALICDQTETDELGIRVTASQMGIDLKLIPFFKSAFAFNHEGYTYRTMGRDNTRILNDVRVFLNRCQSKHRRLYTTTIFESIGKQVVNPTSIEMSCHSKLRTLLALAAKGIQIPRTVYAASNVKESIAGGGVQDNTESICELLERELDGKMVIKPDAGSHGRGVALAENRESLRSVLSTIAPGVSNPSGVIAQELIPKWFYDLRILVYKKKGEHPKCHEDALARGGFKDFRTNTFLGNMVFRAKLPRKVREKAEACAAILGGKGDAWVLALDALPYIPREMMRDEDQLVNSFKELEAPFAEVTRVKERRRKKQRFEKYTEDINRTYTAYMEAEPYRYIEAVVNDTLDKTADNIYFHEGNACPEFWEQTRVVAGINLAEDMLGCAQSLIDR
ncbi:hypothetical protein JXL21_05905 [Candidatus Bathyarchaeota archaeon]|nr:hypothetical protein [Candidatus Bathyarchaeota archaeon]